MKDLDNSNGRALYLLLIQNKRVLLEGGYYDFLRFQN